MSTIKKGMNLKEARLSNLMKHILLLLCVIVFAHNTIQAQNGIIVLEKLKQEPSVSVVATEKVILRPGFHAIASAGVFNAKIGAANSVFPEKLYISQGSTALVNNIYTPGTGQNYVKTTNYLTSDESSSLVTYQYFDGLGRPTQTVSARSTPTGADLVSLIEYDAVGRVSKKWLPGVISGNAGDYVDIAAAKAAAQSKNDDQNPFNQIGYEASPLNRTEKEWGPGKAWYDASKSVVKAYETNTASDIALFVIGNTSGLTRTTYFYFDRLDL
jgi:hypothetical protein